MAELTTERRERPMGEVTREKPMKVVAGGSALEAITGAAAIALAIIGLAGVIPLALAAIASIVAGVGLLMEGAAVGARYQKLAGGARREEAELGGGVTAELLGGAAGITLGILALVGVAPQVLLPVSAISMGGALIIGSGVMSRLNSLAILGHPADDRYVRAASQMVNAAAGAQVLLGIGAATLGILGIIGILEATMPTLSLVAFLLIGAAAFFSGTAVAGKVTTLLSR